MDPAWGDPRPGTAAAPLSSMSDSNNTTTSSRGAKSLPRGGGAGPRACRTCAVAKVRCIPSENDNSRCQRCARLGKDCALQPLKERKKRKSAPRKNRVSQLEQKLDDIVNLLKESQDQDGKTNTDTNEDTNSSSAGSPMDTSHVDSLYHRRTPSAMYTDTIPRSHPIRTMLQVPPASATGFTQTSPLPEPRPAGQVEHFSPRTQQDVCLEAYRSSMSMFFPFVLIPSHISAKELAEMKPFLAEMIFTVSHCQDYGPQNERGKEILRHLTDRLFLEGEKSLDLLQGMLIYITWYRILFYGGRQITTLLQMATSLATDLGLNYPVRQDRYKTVQDVIWTLLQGVVNIQQQSLEERRAFLGCFYLSSWICFSSLGMDPIPYTPYVKECCQVLAEANQSPSDLLAVEMVRIQCVMNSVRQAVPTGPIEMEKFYTSIDLHISAAQQQLEMLRKNWPMSKVIQEQLLLHYYYAEMLLYEIPVFLILNRPNFNPTDWPPDLNHRTIEYLTLLGSSATAALETFFAIHPRNYFQITMMSWEPFIRVLVIVRKLIFLKEVPGWDYKEARRHFDLAGILDKITANTTKASELAREVSIGTGGGWGGCQNNRPDRHHIFIDGKNDMLLDLAARTRRFKAGYLEAVRLEEAGVPTDGQPPVASSQTAHQQQVHTAGGQQPYSQMPPQNMLGTDMWPPPETGETLLTMDDDFWLGFWQEWQLN